MKAHAETCPVTKTAALLSDEWTMRLIHSLLGGPRRFCELERALPGISTRTLTQKLKNLQHKRLVKKSTDGYYAATERGKGLRIIERAMRTYGERYL